MSLLLAHLGGTNTFSYTGQGGITFGGSATLKLVKVSVGSGGLILGGAASLRLTKAFAGSGGVVFGGAGATRLTKAYTGIGGIVFGGSAAFASRFTFQASAGVVFGGSAGLSRRNVYQGAGGVAFGGQAALASVKAFTGSGGLVFGGASEFKRSYAFIASSGIVFGGAATTSLVGGTANYTYVGDGGIVWGGAAVLAFIPVVVAGGGGYLPPFRYPRRRPEPAQTIEPSRGRRVYVLEPSWGGIHFGGSAGLVWRAVPLRTAGIVRRLTVDPAFIRSLRAVSPLTRTPVAQRVPDLEDDEEMLFIFGEL